MSVPQNRDEEHRCVEGADASQAIVGHALADVNYALKALSDTKSWSSDTCSNCSSIGQDSWNSDAWSCQGHGSSAARSNCSSSSITSCTVSLDFSAEKLQAIDEDEMLLAWFDCAELCIAKWKEHRLGICTACIFLINGLECPGGADCRFCHFEHKLMASWEPHARCRLWQSTRSCAELWQLDAEVDTPRDSGPGMSIQYIEELSSNGEYLASFPRCSEEVKFLKKNDAGGPGAASGSSSSGSHRPAMPPGKNKLTL